MIKVSKYPDEFYASFGSTRKKVEPKTPMAEEENLKDKEQTRNLEKLIREKEKQLKELAAGGSDASKIKQQAKVLGGIGDKAKAKAKGKGDPLKAKTKHDAGLSEISRAQVDDLLNDKDAEIEKHLTVIQSVIDVLKADRHV